MQFLDTSTSSSGLCAEVIAVRGLTFTYPKASAPSLQGIDFTVGRGEIWSSTAHA